MTDRSRHARSIGGAGDDPGAYVDREPDRRSEPILVDRCPSRSEWAHRHRSNPDAPATVGASAVSRLQLIRPKG